MSSTRRARRSLRRRSWLALWALVLGFWASTATGVSWALPMPHFSRVSQWLGSAYQSAMGVWDGRSHAVSGASTRAHSGALGRAAGRAPGELPAYQAQMSAHTPSRTGAFPRGGGFDVKTSVLVASMSSARENVYKNTDGSFTARLYSQDVNFRRADGSWGAIDTTLRVHQFSGRRSYAVASSASDAQFAGSAADPALVSLQVDSSDTVAFGIQGAAPVAPMVSGSTATYSSVFTDTDVVLDPTAAGVKESLVLHSTAAPTQYVYPLALTGVTASIDASGAVIFTNASGTAVAEIPHGEMSDANVAPYTDLAPSSDGVTYSLETVNGSPALVMTLDSSWLGDPSRVFPVTVDPTVTPLNASSSTDIEAPCVANQSSNPTLKVGTPGTTACGGTLHAISYLKFPSVTSQLANDYVTAASLTMYNVWSYTCTPEPWAVGSVQGTWSATDQMAWSSKPSFGSNLVTSETDTPGQACGTNTGSTNGAFMTAQLNPGAFNGWTSGGSANNGLAVFAPTTSGGYPSDVNQWKQFASTAAGVAANNYPYLSLTYQANTAPNIVSANPRNAQALQTLTPELTAQAQDPDSFPGGYNSAKSLQYEFRVMDDTTGTPVQTADSGTLTSASATSPASWVVPSGALKWSGADYWQVRASDQLGWGFWSQPAYFGLSIAQPPMTSHLAQNGGQGFDASVGNYTTQATDADVTTVGPPLEVQRSYNSLDPRSGLAFGSGWASVLDSTAAVDGDGTGNVVVTYASGQQMRFGRNADGSFSAPSGTFATLTAASASEPSGSHCPAVASGYCLLDKSGSTYGYTVTLPSGAFGLSTVVDHAGRATKFTYDGNSRMVTMSACVSGCLTSSPVIARSVHFAWSQPSGASFWHVTQVSTDPVIGADATTDLVWTYTYNGDQLTHVCTPVEQAGSCAQQTGYGYESGSQYSASVLDAGPQAYWRLDDASGATSAGDQVLANEGSDDATPTNVTFGESDGPLAGTSGATAAQFTGNSQILLPSGLVTGQSYLTVGLWFKTTAAGILFAEQNQAMGSSTTPSHATASLYVGTDGMLHGAWYAGSSGQLVSTKSVIDGGWHYAVLSAAGNTQSLYLDGAQVGSPLSGSIQNLDQSIAYVGAGYSSGLWPAQPPMGYDYFTGEIAEVAFYGHALGGPAIAAQYADQQHASQLLTSITKPSGASQASITYAVAADRVQSVTDANGGTWQLSAPSVAGSSAVYRAAVLGSSPQGYWRLNDYSRAAPVNGVWVARNEVTNTSATASAATSAPYSNVTLGAASPFADTTAASFDGSSSSLQLPGSLLPASGPASVELWFNTTANKGILFNQQSAALSSAASGAMVSTLYIGTDGKLYGGFYTTAGKVSMTSPATVTDGQWHDVVLSTDGSDQSLYLDGYQVGSAISSTPIAQNSQPYVYVGAGDTGSSWPALPNLSEVFFKGSIAEVSTYRGALSAGAVQAHYGALKTSTGLTPVTTVLVGVPRTTVACGQPTISSLSTSNAIQAPGSGLQSGFGNCAHQAERFDPSQGGRIIASTDVLGGTTSYGYDTGGFLHTVTDPDGDATITGHDVRGNQISKTTCQSLAQNLCSTSYDTYWPDDQTPTLTPDPRDDVMTASRDGRSASASDPTYMTQYAYDGNGNVTAVTDPLGRTTTSTYSTGTEAPLAVSLATNGAPTCAVNPPAAGVIPAALALSKKTPGGATTSYAYYANGDLAQSTSPLGQRTVYAYDGLGRVLFKTVCSDTSPNGTVTGYQYDGAGRVTQETDPATTDAVSGVAHQKVTQSWYTADGQVDHTIVSDAGGSSTPDTSRTTSYTYFSTGLVQSVTDPAGRKTSYTYDLAGDKATVTDPAKTTQYEYDLDNRLTKTELLNYAGTATGVCQTAGSSTLIVDNRAYDAAGRLASDLDGMCRQTTYTYFDNALTASVTRVDPSKTDGSGVTESKTYDGAGALLSDSKGNGTAVTLTSYDAAGQSVLTRVLAGADSSGNALYKNTQTSYDADEHVSSMLKWRDGVPGVEQTDYTHDAAGDITSQTVHDSNAAQAASANLAGAWPLNDGATTSAKDGSGGNRPATVSGWTGWSGDAPSGHSGSLWVDGASGQAATSSVPVDTAKDYSVSAWAKLDHTPTGSQTVVTVSGSTTDAFYLDYSQPTGGWTMQTTTVDSSSPGRPYVAQSTAPAVGVWTHLVGTYNAETKTLALYVNGTLIGTASVSAAWSAGGQVLIGTSGGNFAGKIADVQLWNRTLAQNDVNELYNHISLGSRGLAGSWALNDGVSNQGADASGSGHPAAVTGGVSFNASRGGAAVLDGSSGYLATGAPMLNTNNSYTVAAWVNMNQPASYATVLSQSGASMSAFYLQYSSAFNTWAFSLPTSDVSGTTQARAYSTSVTPAWNTWTFLAGVYDAGKKTATLYVGNTAVSTVPVTGTFNAPGPLVIGAVRTTGGALSNQVPGAVSGVGVYGAALTQSQIQTLDNGGSLTAPATVIKTTWTYDRRGIKTSMTSPMGNAQGASAGSYTTYYTSDQLGRSTQVQQPAITTYVGGVAAAGVAPITWSGYDTFGEVRETQDPNGNITATGYNQDGQPTGSTLPPYTQPGAGGQSLLVSTQIDYNPDGTVLDRIDPAGNKTSYTYDQFGDVLTQTNPPISVGGVSTAGVVQNQYDQDGELTQVTDPTGAVTQAAYDYLGQKSSQTAVVRQPSTAQDTTTYTYDTLGNRTSITTPTLVKIQTGYDPAGEKTSSIDGAGNTTTYAYDVDGRMTRTVNPDGSSLANTYDLAGNLTWHGEYDHTGALARSQSATYYLDGTLYQASDFLGAVTSFSYDQDGNLTGQIEPTATGATITTSYGYDAAGHRTQQTLGNGNTTVYTYNSWGLPESKILPAAGSYTTSANRTFTTVYDQDGNPVTQTQPGGTSVTTTFDALANLTRQSGAGASATSATRVLGYDLDGRVTTAATQDGSGNALTTDTFSYDDRGALLTTSGSSGTSSFTYNPAGQMATRTDASSTNPTSYTYDTAGRLYTIADPLTGATGTYGYNTLNQVTSIGYTTGGTADDTRTFGYDTLHRLNSDTLTAAAGAQVAAIDYTYNNDDQEIEQDTWGIGTTSATTKATNTYGYDQAGRLTSWNNGATTTYYGYDGDGNRTCITTNTAGCTTANSTYQYNPRDQLTADATHTYTYAANGTLTGITTTATNATEAFTFDAYQQMAADAATGYAYDALGRTVTAGTVALKYSGQGNQIASDNNVTLYSHDPAGAVLGVKFVSSGSATLAWSDAHQNLVARFTPTGSGLTAWSVYDPLGNKTATSGTQIAIGYQSGYTTGGKVNMAARWYNPTTGQFTSADTQDNTPNPASVNTNPYTYANDNPLTGIDPTGHSELEGGGDGGGGGDPAGGTVTVGGDGASGGGGDGPGSGPNGENGIGMPAWMQEELNGLEAQFSTAQGELGRVPQTSSQEAYEVESAGYDTSRELTGGGLSESAAEQLLQTFQYDIELLYAYIAEANGTLDECIAKGQCVSLDGGNGDYCHGNSCLDPRPPSGDLNNPKGGPCRGPNCFGPPPPPPPPPAWAVNHKRPDPDCIGGCVTHGTPNLASIVELDSAYNPDTATNQGSQLGTISDGIRFRGDGTSCDTGPGFNGAGNIVYLPRHMQAGECVATGAFATLTQADYTPPPRPSLKFELPGRRDILTEDWARGHLIAFSLGGSNRDTRNFVPMYQTANENMFLLAEQPVLNAITTGGKVRIGVIPIYGNPSSAAPTEIEYISWGSVNETCIIENDAVGDVHC